MHWSGCFFSLQTHGITLLAATILVYFAYQRPRFESVQDRSKWITLLWFVLAVLVQPIPESAMAKMQLPDCARHVRD